MHWYISYVFAAIPPFLMNHLEKKAFLKVGIFPTCINTKYSIAGCTSYRNVLNISLIIADVKFIFRFVWNVGHSHVVLCVCRWELVVAHRGHEKHQAHEAGNSLLLCSSFIFLPGLFRGSHGWVHLFKSAWWDSGESSEMANLISACANIYLISRDISLIPIFMICF